MLKDFIDQKGRSVYCRAREVWWVSIGHNVGHEIDGKGERYTRPVIVVRSFGINTFLGVPLTSSLQGSGEYRVQVSVPGARVINYAVINQLRVIRGLFA